LHRYRGQRVRPHAGRDEKGEPRGGSRVLAGLLGTITKPGGVKALGSLLKEGNLLGAGLAAVAGASGSRSTAGSGIGALTSLLGEGKLPSVIDAIGGVSGIGHSQSRSLIGMLFPV